MSIAKVVLIVSAALIREVYFPNYFFFNVAYCVKIEVVSPDKVDRALPKPVSVL